MNGRLIGINSAIFTQTGSSVGIGFAIPVNMVKIVVAAAKTGQQACAGPGSARACRTSRATSPIRSASTGPPARLSPTSFRDGPAAKAGVKHGDLIAAVDGQSVDDPESFGYRLATKPLGGTAALALIRNGKPLSVTLALTPAPEIPPRDPVKLAGDSPFAGATVVNLSPAVIEDISLHRRQRRRRHQRDRGWLDRRGSQFPERRPRSVGQRRQGQNHARPGARRERPA